MKWKRQRGVYTARGYACGFSIQRDGRRWVLTAVSDTGLTLINRRPFPTLKAAKAHAAGDD